MTASLSQSPNARSRWLHSILLLLPLLASMIAGCLAPVRAVPTPTPWPTPVLSEQKRYTVTRGTVEDRFQLVAEVAPLRWEPLAFAVDGKLGAVLVREGEEAEEGQILAELIMPDLLEQLEQASLDLSKNESVLWVYENEQSFNLERAQLEARRVELLLEQARNAGDTDQIALQEVALDLAQLNLREVENRVDPSLGTGGRPRPVGCRCPGAPSRGTPYPRPIFWSGCRRGDRSEQYARLPGTAATPRRCPRLFPLYGHR